MNSNCEQKKIFILIPAYNEERSIKEVIASVKKEGFENILVVNDDSQDKTAELARKAGAEVLNHIINRGQGAALKTGINYLKESKNPDIIVTFDADGQHQPKDISKLIAPIIDEEADIVLGSRFLDKKCHVPFIRKIILKAGIIFTRLISDIKITDTHNGFRALGKRAIKSINITHRGMEHASDIIEEIKAKNLRYKEVPVEIIYSEYSKMKGQKNSGFAKMGLKILIKKLTQ